MHWVQLNCDQALVSKIMSQITTKTAGYRSVMEWIPGLCKALLTFSPLSCSNIFVCVLLLSLKTNSWCSVSHCARPVLIVNAVSGCLCYFCLGGEKDKQPVSAVVMWICVSDGGCYLCHTCVLKRFLPRYQDMTTRSWLCVFWLYGVCISVTENWHWNGIQTRTLTTRMRQRKNSKSCQRPMKFSQTVRQNKKLVYLKCTVWNELYWSHYCLRCEACAIKKQWHSAPVV